MREEYTGGFTLMYVCECEMGNRIYELLRLEPSGDSRLRRWIHEISVSLFGRLTTSRNFGGQTISCVSEE